MITDYLVIILKWSLILAPNYLTGISIVFSGSRFSSAPAIFKNQQLTEVPACYFDKCLLKLYHIKVATIQYSDCNIKYFLLVDCGSTWIWLIYPIFGTEYFSNFYRAIWKNKFYSCTEKKRFQRRRKKEKHLNKNKSI